MLAQLSLWLETARKDRKLSDLSDRLKAADSLASDWSVLFPGVTFDAVIGNPPYVRMELFKNQKPHLKKRFPEVHEERADLYCYFFQLSLELLREGGRYGIIVSNKWVRAKYGTPLRAYLKSKLRLEKLLDFGELPVFESAAVMPLILVGEKQCAGQDDDLRFSQIEVLPVSDLELESIELQHGIPVPPDQLNEESWLLVDQVKRAVFDSRKTQGVPLREYLGTTPICLGVKSGLTKAFHLSQDQRDEFVAKNPEVKEILMPLVIGDEVRRWAISQDESSYLIYTPKNRFTEEEFLDRFPVLAAHLAPFRSYPQANKRTGVTELAGLDHRGTTQNWFELQQAQEAYEQYFGHQKLLWPETAMESRWAIEANGDPKTPNNKCFFIPGADYHLLGVFNSPSVWSMLSDTATTIGSPSQGGRLELREHIVGKLLIPPFSQDVADLAKRLSEYATSLESHRRIFTRFLRQDAPWCCPTLGLKLEAFWTLDEKTVLSEALKRRDKTKKHKDPTAGERAYLISSWREAREPILDLKDKLQKLETELEKAVEASWS